MNVVLDKLKEIGPDLDAQADEADALGRLTDEMAKRLDETGIMRMLQPREYGGLESTPMEWFEALTEIGLHSGSATWVSGVVGVHPFEVAQGTRQLQEEIWGEDTSVWVASPYAPFGRARRVDGGYLFTGRWPWSTGNYHCEWAVLGGLIVDESGEAGDRETATRHFFIPKSDYQTFPDEWQIAGLSGTGSFDIAVNEVFVPDHRVIDPRELNSGEAARAAGVGDRPLYRMPFNTMFSGTIAAGALAICGGFVRAFDDYARVRVTRRGNDVTQDVHLLVALGEATADLDAGMVQFMHDIERMWDFAVAGREIPVEVRLQTRRNQVRAVQRAIHAIDELMRHAGGAAMNAHNPIQRFWRDAHTGANHGANLAEGHYVNFGLHRFGHPLPPGARV